MSRWFLLFLCGLVSLTSGVFATSIRLENDTTVPLRAVVHGADGSFLGDLLVMPQASVKWADTYNPLDKGNSPPQGPSRSQTPLTVIWYCTSGDNYGICDNVSTGALVKAGQSVGNRHCDPSPKTKEPTSESSE